MSLNDWPAKVRPIITRYGMERFCAAARLHAVHECFAAVFTLHELLAIESHLKEKGHTQ